MKVNSALVNRINEDYTWTHLEGTFKEYEVEGFKLTVIVETVTNEKIELNMFEDYDKNSILDKRRESKENTFYAYHEYDLISNKVYKRSAIEKYLYDWCDDFKIAEVYIKKCKYLMRQSYYTKGKGYIEKHYVYCENSGEIIASSYPYTDVCFDKHGGDLRSLDVLFEKVIESKKIDTILNKKCIFDEYFKKNI